MSRSNQGGKAPGWEFWSRRPMAGSRGAWAKAKCHRIERRQGKAEAKGAIDDDKPTIQEWPDTDLSDCLNDLDFHIPQLFTSKS